MSTTDIEDADANSETGSSTATQSPAPDEIRKLAADVRQRGFDELATWLDERAEETAEVAADG